MARYGLIGRNLVHSQSKLLHSQLGNYEYDMIEVQDASGLREVLEDTSYNGFNVTIPYKKEVIGYLDELSGPAAEAESVNVIKRLKDGRLKGFNTDSFAFAYMVGDRVKGRKCVVLGTGGAARSVAHALREKGAAEITLISRNPSEAANRLGDNYNVAGYDNLVSMYDAQVIINATPVGTVPDIEKTPMDYAGCTMRVFDRLELAVDLIYNPYRTRFLQDARRLTGCKTMSGLEMLIVQAMGSNGIWEYDSPGLPKLLTWGVNEEYKGKAPDRRRVKDIKKKILLNQLNFVSVGMPGSGKTTICRRFAYELGLEFVDIDEETEKLMGESIETVLGEGGRGERYFREMETRAVLEASRKTGAVISTGGGSILNPINRDYLRSNGIVIYIQRPVELLATKNRPISQRTSLRGLFAQRDKLYSRMADISVLNARVFGEQKALTGEGNSYNYELKKYVYYLNTVIERKLDEIAGNKWT